MILSIQPQLHSSHSPVPGMEGLSPGGTRLSVNSLFLELDGKPWLPVMGEFHYARCRASFWEEELVKMKACGIDVISTYVFWIHHEEEEGSFDWGGRRDLGKFVTLCGKHGLYSFPRIGPWCHGEVRNGGHPDWILHKDITARSTDPVYIEYVSKLYAQIAEQLSGLYWKDGGPIIGIQIENEFCAHGPGFGSEYLLCLKKLAIDNGIIAPLFTMTGWGNPDVPRNELLPVFGGYPDSFWDSAEKADQSPNYSFSSTRCDGEIGTDLGLIEKSEREREWAPYLTCETGPGMQVAYHRRPFIEPDDVVAISLVKLGSGSNMPGYYVFHGGVNPEGRLTRLNEDHHCNMPNDTPVYSYDFQAPLGEFGQVRESYHAYIPLHLFIRHFGSQLAPMRATISQATRLSPFDNSRLRWACRTDGNAGFIFVNNHVRNHTTPCFPDVQLQLRLETETITVPQAPLSIPEGTYFIWPVNMLLDTVLLKYATVQPLCRLDTSNTWVFFAVHGIRAELAFDADTVEALSVPPSSNIAGDGTRVVSDLRPGTDCVLSATNKQGREVRIIVLTAEHARNCFNHQDAIHISDGGILAYAENQLVLETAKSRNTILSYPLTRLPKQETTDDALFSSQVIECETPELSFSWRVVQDAETLTFPVSYNTLDRPVVPADNQYDSGAIIALDISPDILENVHDVILRIDYVGDSGRLFVGDKFVHDHFYNGRPWEISLRYFAPEILHAPARLKILPLRADAKLYLDKRYRPEFAEKKQVLEIRSIQAIPIHRRRIDYPRRIGDANRDNN